jgi:hypothetical protein
MYVNETAKCQATSFSTTLGGGANWPTEVVGITTLLKCDKNNRFLTLLVAHVRQHPLDVFTHVT